MSQQHAYDLRPHDPPPPRATDSAQGDLRLITAPADFHACVGLQTEIWGAEFGDRVPASLLQVAAHIGGVVIGAFGPDGTLLGFVFGLTGVKDGAIVHWSHMLGVREEAREMGIGRRLKEFQRALLAARGVAHTYWTFDPLQAKNAHLNFNRLGVRVVQYAVDMYGTTTSPLHYGLATDRLIVMSSNVPGAETPAVRATPSVEPLPILTLAPQPADVLLDPDARPRAALIEIPADLRAVIAKSAAAGLAWRAATRRHFDWAISNGYTVTHLQRDPATGRAFYVIARTPTDRET